MKKLVIANIVGARPNFMKMAPLIKEMKKHKELNPLLIHTGQHYDRTMSGIFFRQLRMPKPDIDLGIGSGTHAEQTGRIMIELEKVFLKVKPGLIVVVGDVNSTVAATLVGAKLNIPVAHVEAGLRSYDRSMPEEINRLITDTLSDYLFTPSRDASRNLNKEGISNKKIHFVGNVMIDTLGALKQKAMRTKCMHYMGLKPSGYSLLTLHRPSNVDDKHSLQNIFRALRVISKNIPIIFPMHPRTQKFIKLFKLTKYINSSNIRVVAPLGYMDFLNLMANAMFVLTDSGGIQEETTVLGVPCLTMRKNTERPITVSQGTNTLVGNSYAKITGHAAKILSSKPKKHSIPEFWDGNASKRIVKVLLNNLMKFV